VNKDAEILLKMDQDDEAHKTISSSDKRSDLKFKSDRTKEEKKVDE